MILNMPVVAQRSALLLGLMFCANVGLVNAAPVNADPVNVAPVNAVPLNARSVEPESRMLQTHPDLPPTPVVLAALETASMVKLARSGVSVEEGSATATFDWPIRVCRASRVRAAQ